MRVFGVIWIYLFGTLLAPLLTREEALAAVFPGAQFKSELIFLTQEQQSKVADLSEGKVPSALIARYIARKDGGVVGRAYVDTHLVRTKKESLLICLDERGDLRRIEVTAFLDPRSISLLRSGMPNTRGESWTMISHSSVLSVRLPERP